LLNSRKNGYVRLNVTDGQTVGSIIIAIALMGRDTFETPQMWLKSEIDV
jgi:hypothetical protein